MLVKHFNLRRLAVRKYAISKRMVIVEFSYADHILDCYGEYNAAFPAMNSAQIARSISYNASQNSSRDMVGTISFMLWYVFWTVFTVKDGISWYMSFLEMIHLQQRQGFEP